MFCTVMILLFQGIQCTWMPKNYSSDFQSSNHKLRPSALNKLLQWGLSKHSVVAFVVQVMQWQDSWPCFLHNLAHNSQFWSIKGNVSQRRIGISRGFHLRYAPWNLRWVISFPRCNIIWALRFQLGNGNCSFPGSFLVTFWHSENCK